MATQRHAHMMKTERRINMYKIYTCVCVSVLLDEIESDMKRKENKNKQKNHSTPKNPRNSLWIFFSTSTFI